MNHMRTNRLLALLLLGSWLLVLGLATATEQVERLPVAASDEPHIRNKRGIFWDFFQKMVITKNLIVDVCEPGWIVINWILHKSIYLHYPTAIHRHAKHSERHLQHRKWAVQRPGSSEADIAAKSNNRKAGKTLDEQHLEYSARMPIIAKSFFCKCCILYIYI